MKNNRPKNLNLLTIRFPVPAIVSILHRISGVILFFLFPLLLWMFSYSLISEDNFLTLQSFLSSPGMKFFIWLCLAPLCYHLAAGIRHLAMDIHLGEELMTSRIGAWITILISIVLIVWVGVWLW